MLENTWAKINAVREIANSNLLIRQKKKRKQKRRISFTKKPPCREVSTHRSVAKEKLSIVVVAVGTYAGELVVRDSLED